MISDAERREVVARLRSVDMDDFSCYSAEFEGLYRAIGLYDGEEYSEQDWPERLADLIEPCEPKVRCVAEVKVDGERLERLAHDAAAELTGIDRDALLEEVKELEKCAWYFGLDFDEDEPLRDRLKEASEAFAESARRIREALGVEI